MARDPTNSVVQQSSHQLGVVFLNCFPKALHIQDYLLGSNWAVILDVKTIKGQYVIFTNLVMNCHILFV